MMGISRVRTKAFFSSCRLRRLLADLSCSSTPRSADWTAAMCVSGNSTPVFWNDLKKDCRVREENEFVPCIFSTVVR